MRGRVVGESGPVDDVDVVDDVGHFVAEHPRRHCEETEEEEGPVCDVSFHQLEDVGAALGGETDRDQAGGQEEEESCEGLEPHCCRPHLAHTGADHLHVAQHVGHGQHDDQDGEEGGPEPLVVHGAERCEDELDVIQPHTVPARCCLGRVCVEGEEEEDGEEGEDDVAEGEDPAVPQYGVAVLVIARVGGDHSSPHLEREDHVGGRLQPGRHLAQHCPVRAHQAEEGGGSLGVHQAPDHQGDQQPVDQGNHQQADLADGLDAGGHQDVGEQGHGCQGGHVVGDDVLDLVQGGLVVVGVVGEADTLVLDGVDEAVAAPHGDPQVRHRPHSSHEAERDSEAGEERTEVAVEPTHGEGGVLAQQHLQQQQGQPQHHQQAEVHQQEDDPAVPDDGLGEVEEGVEGQGEGPGGGQGVGAPGPLGPSHQVGGVAGLL